MIWLLLAAAGGIGVWAYRRTKRSSELSLGPSPRDRRLEAEEAARAQARVGAADIGTAEARIDDLVRMIQDSDGVYRALAAISTAGGGAPGQDGFVAAMRDPGAINRPWWWLAAVAELAERSGQDRAAAKIGFFIEMFIKQMLPKLNLAGSIDAGLSAPPDAARGRIAAATLAATARLRPDDAVISDRTGTVPVRGVELLAAQAVIALDGKGVAIESDTVTRAATIVGGGGR